MRVAIAGLMHESNTFLPLRTGWQEFAAGSFTSGKDLLEVWSDAHHELGGFIAGAREYGLDLVPTVMAWATPGGPVSDVVLDDVVNGLVQAIRAEQAEGLLLALHGAMVAESYPSGDAEVLRRVRSALGPKVPMIVTLDYHANVSPAFAAAADALLAYQTYPHIDQRECGLAAARLMARTLRGEIHPVAAVAKPPLLVNILGQETVREPMRSLLARARELEQSRGILSVSVLAGFPYADVPDAGASVIAVADGDVLRAQAVANELAAALWKVRGELNVSCPAAPEAVRQALASPERPVVLVDLGDNVGGGSAGDGTVLLAELLRQRATGAVVTLYSPDGISAAVSAGAGRAFYAPVGGAVDRHHGNPLTLRGTVVSLHDGKWVEPEPRHGGRRFNDQGTTAVVEIEGGNRVVLNSLRTPPFSLGQLTSLGIEPRKCHFLVVKAAVAYKAAYAPIAGRIIEVDTPGLTAVNPARFVYRRLRRPIYPLDAMADADYRIP